MFEGIKWWYHRRSLLKQVAELCEMQGLDGNWNYDAYLHGMYNGMEFLRSLLENRKPEFRNAPEGGYIGNTPVDPTLVDKMVKIAKSMPDDLTQK